MELKDAILTRRSYTKYLDKKVDLKLIADILNTAIYAPSSGNMQNWYIVLVDDEMFEDFNYKFEKHDDFDDFFL